MYCHHAGVEAFDINIYLDIEELVIDFCCSTIKEWYSLSVDRKDHSSSLQNHQLVLAQQTPVMEVAQWQQAH